VLNTVIFSPQVGFTGNFLPDSFQTMFLADQFLTPLFSLTLPDF